MRQIVHAVHDKLLKMPFEMKGGDSRNMIVFFESSHGDMPRDQIADALCSNSVLIVLIVSQSTFDSIANLQPDSLDNGALAAVLTQYEMALERFEQEGVVVLPVLIDD